VMMLMKAITKTWCWRPLTIMALSKMSKCCPLTSSSTSKKDVMLNRLWRRIEKREFDDVNRLLVRRQQVLESIWFWSICFPFFF
jgi:hypothetical protein